MGHINNVNDHLKTRDIRNAGISLFVITLLLISAIPAYADAPTSSDNVSTYIVVFNDTPAALSAASSNSVSTFAASHGGSVKYQYNIINGMAITIPDSEASRLSELPNVKYVEKDGQCTILLDKSIPQIGADQVWLQGYNGSGIKVAVIDTGVDAGHPDLNGTKVIAWKDFVNTSNLIPMDDHGHGTHVSGIIAGSGNASAGKYTGVAPGASLIEVKVLDKTGSGSYSNVIAGIDWAVNNGANVISMSLGGSHDQSMDDAVSNAVSRGVVVVVAAGNSGPSSGTIECPGDAPAAITVGAVNDTDVIASWSSRGPSRDGSIKPDVVNAGNLIISDRAWNTHPSGSYPIDNYYTIMSGTSMATPMTSGVVALILQKNKDLTPAQVKYILEQTAKPIGSVQPNNNYGWGRVWANGSVDNASYSTIGFNVSSYYVNENAGTVTINITKAGNNLFPASVNYATADGTAYAGINYQAKSGTLSFQPADTYKTFTVNIINDGIASAQKYFIVNLASPANATITLPVSAQVFINDINLTADFTSNVTGGMSPLNVQFNDTSIGMITDWQWNFDDGTGNSSVRNATHTFTNAGPAAKTFNVTLTASNASGSNTKKIMNYITVNPQPPVANLASNITAGNVPLTVQFSDTSTGTVNGWQWNFGDGTGNSTIKDPIHIFNAPGTYSVILTVYNAGGSSTKRVVNDIVVHNATPVANFNTNVTVGYSLLAVQFNNISTGNNITGWQWNFGDGSGNATISDPIHVFTNNGPMNATYTITLTVMNDGGSSTKRSIDYIKVVPQKPVANFSCNRTMGDAPLTIQFNDTSTGGIANVWQWNFGDGTLNVTSKDPVHTFNSGGNHTVTLTAFNAGGNSTSLKVNYINITGASLIDYTYELVPDWNLISVPLNVTDKSIDGFFPAEVRNEIVDLWGWNSSAQKWTYYSPDPNTPFKGYEPITTMDAGKAYWVNMNSSASFSIQGVEPKGVPNATIPLVPDWNFVGLTGMSPVASNVMYPTSVDVWGWNATVQKWTYYSPDPNTPFVGYEPLTIVKPGLGQWVNM